ncbi:SUF system Fe-S cluster assembly regulator [Wenzhouxiangella marina]|uniref:Rrf2 family transcriptional regulator n=1 Tax=Wenzhouxiangella marina TaxID=1579979 RepID=A0A0K0XYQ1_9GAMM|nr:SUF system Fe-S cluster assembly regulator [Wenzhouxiangella marina]AKS42818.1 Rrf2 family transcriptional regulator [Wenzhouxiangella marina]MBB6087503.1 FeS assembly SUF system regulator [Wenzhouxiangella marina]
MLRISKLTDYATVLLAELARQPEACVAASVLAEATRLEVPTVAKVLKTLARADLVSSVRGVNGGYRLASAPEAVSVAAIVRAMEGPIALTECGLEPGLCAHESNCHLRGNWQRIGVAVEQALEALSLADLAGEEPQRISIRTVSGDREIA